MPSEITPQDLKLAAEAARDAGDHMTAMDLFGEAAELAWEQGLTELADLCAQMVNQVVAQIAEIENMQLPPDR
jgi:hypothetical protein